MVRTERRRQIREQTAMEIRALDDNTGSPWELIAPHLDEGLNSNSSANAILCVPKQFCRPNSLECSNHLWRASRPSKLPA
jgi:hypothetical protein